MKMWGSMGRLLILHRICIAVSVSLILVYSVCALDSTTTVSSESPAADISTGKMQQQLLLHMHLFLAVCTRMHTHLFTHVHIFV